MFFGLLLLAAFFSVSDDKNLDALISNHQITPQVNVITGEYVVDACDIVVAGCEPLSVRRFYGHFNPSNEWHGHWRFNPEHFCLANFEWEKDTFVAVGEFNGSISCCQKHGDKSYSFSAEKNPGYMNLDLTGQSHPLNMLVKYQNKPWKDGLTYWEGEIQSGTGGIRLFKSGAFAWSGQRKFRYPHLLEEPYFTSPEDWMPYLVPLTEEKLPNGNCLCYEYDHKLVGGDNPAYPLIKKITAYNRDKTKELGWLNFNYQRDFFTVTGSDGRQVVYRYGIHQRIGMVETPDQPIVCYNPVKNPRWDRLYHAERPDGRIFKTEYYPKAAKVQYHEAPFGPDGNMQIVSSYVYQDSATEKRDAEGNLTIYRYDVHKKLTAIEIYRDGKIDRVDSFVCDPTTGNLRLKTVKDGNGKLFLEEKYQYDEKHNVVVETKGDENGSYSVYRDYSKDGFNLLLREWDDFGKDIRYGYKPGTNLLASELVYDGDRIVKRVFYFYDDCAILVKTIQDDGVSTDYKDLAFVSYRKIRNVEPKYSQPCFGLPKVVEEKTINTLGEEVLLERVEYEYHPSGKIVSENHYDSVGVKRFTLTNKYDARERLKESTDALGYKTTYEYDANNNLIELHGIDSGKHRKISYDKGNRPYLVEELEGDDRYLTKRREYDKCSNVKFAYDECGQKTAFEYDHLNRCKKEIAPDGSICTKDYDILNRLNCEVDAKGEVTTKRYDFRGNVTKIVHSDGVEETSGYFPNGLIEWHCDRNGAKTLYKYDALGHPIEQLVYDEFGTLLKQTSATWSGYSQLSSTDAKGVTTFYCYDFAGRKIAERVGERVTRYSYDTLGRMCRIDKGNVATIQEFDLLDHVIETRIEDSDGRIVRKEEYRYDAAGNKTHVINSKGTSITEYNKLGMPTIQTDPNGNKTRLFYYYDGEFKKQICGPDGVYTKMRYDSKGKLVESIKKDKMWKVLQRMECKYDLNGNLKEEKHAIIDKGKEIGNLVHIWEYEVGNRLKEFVEAGKKTTRYFYDARGRLKTVVKPNQRELHSEYDDLGRLKRFYSVDFDYTYSYDGLDRVKRVEDHYTKTTTEREYDDYGNLKREKIASGLEVFYDYDLWGKRKRFVVPNGTKIQYGYRGDDLISVSRGDFTHRYVERDLEGLLKKVELAASLGSVIITRDRVGRWRNVSSPYYEAHFDDEAYDVVNNLMHYTFTDGLGSKDERYVYDSLNQLEVEEGAFYRSDSIYNRRAKNFNTYSVNLLSQVESDGSRSYSYDDNGNMIDDGENTYVYDSQDRLVQVNRGAESIYFSYDCFHRRLSKRVNGEETLYYWDGNNEIGSAKDGKCIELRVLGEGLGAEIGSAVLLELEGKCYVPLHDHRGAVVTLVDVDTKEVADTSRYTAFGELKQGGKLSPWGFASKRRDDETGLIYFGRRYYNPELGRWITADPQGFTDGPNLYAYVHNCPMNACDLYGLKVHDADHRGGLLNDLYRLFVSDRQEKAQSSGPCYQEFERNFENRSRAYTLGREKIANFQMGFINGIGNTFENSFDSAFYLSNLLGGLDVEGVYNASHGILRNIHKVDHGLHRNTMYEPSIKLHANWDRFFEKNPDGIYLQYCHSHGAIHARYALETYPEDRRKQIGVVAVAPACYIPKEICLDVHHYASNRDFVPMIDKVGRKNCADTTIWLDPHKNAPLFDHAFQSPTFENAIKFEFERYIRYVKEVR